MFKIKRPTGRTKIVVVYPHCPQPLDNGGRQVDYPMYPSAGACGLPVFVNNFHMNFTSFVFGARAGGDIAMKLLAFSLIVSISFVGFFVPRTAFASTSGPNNGSTFANDTSIGAEDWSTPDGVETSGGSKAEVDLDDNEISRYLKVTGFGFAIPSGATIDGIKVEVERDAQSANKIKDNSVKIVKGGVIGTENKADTSNFWGTSDLYVSYGSTTDLWSTTWTPADINASNFGFVFAAKKDTTEGSDTKARVDHIRITITYTPVADTTPDAFSFTDKTGVALSTLITSATTTVTGINSPAAISVVDGEYSVNGGAYTSSAGTVNNGNEVQVRHTSSAFNSTSTTTTLTIGGVNGTFTSTTVAEVVPPDTTPDAFSFTDKTGVALSTLITSATTTVTGINSPAAISVVDGEYSVNGGAYTSSAGTVNNGNEVQVRHTSSAFNSTSTTTTLTIGGVNGTFTSTTVATNSAKDITSFDFASPAVTGTVDNVLYTVALTVPFGTNVTALVPTIVITGASVSPVTGSAQDFTLPVTYTVTAANASSQAYLVTVTVSAPPPPPPPVVTNGSIGIFPTPVITTTTTAPQGQVLGAATFNFIKNLMRGSQGVDVTELQKALIAAGFDIPLITKRGVPYGYFDIETRGAVIAFQIARGIIPPTGFVGALTRAELNKGGTPAGSGSGLSDAQVNAILEVLLEALQSFNADASVIDNVRKSLGR